ncbi:MAG: adenylosuccinate lyase [Chloroflexi bacterium]|nr:adenylosuccinate lyase [Chloroflexota bacterium]|tara:strand:- start:2620 stop:3909 length:1290 start_codon:yes stop_codon:yes gene_type:complete
MIERYSRPKMKQIWSDENKYNKWLLVEIAVCEAWTQEGVIPESDMAKLRNVNYDPKRLREILDITKHDMTAFLRSITEKIGPEGRWLHLGLTTSDVWDTATSLQLIEAANLLEKELDILITKLSELATNERHTLMIGRTHGVHAEPITFGLKLAIWWDEMRRAKLKLQQAKNSISVGKLSGPVGTYATIPPKLETKVCDILGIQAAPVSNQIVQRDRHAHFVTTLALIASSLDKFATEIRGMQRTEVREVEEPFSEGQTGSSSMPHKRNPELTERVCGLARLIRGHSLTSMENVALWGERDISHSSAERIILPDSCLALDYMLSIFNHVMSGLRIYRDRMLENIELTHGLVFSQRVMLELVEKGISRENAYEIVQSNASLVWEQQKDFRDLISNDARVKASLSKDEILEIFNYNYYIRYIDEVFDRLKI